ncbi:thermonuclease family protein [Gemella sp. zg-570]|uniref:thermonuclease family protein n=1 Tax=Gemella sp. zg-570 TaxID=2840371 RepID=UPI001C0BDC5E|nr:thermonuclease family protein [Gemella sp. zg-570]QWQ38431.1 thermonuclease family protein [Gemella sp. zg-570]
MNKKLYAILSLIFTIALVFTFYIFKNPDVVNIDKVKPGNINGINVKGDTTRYEVKFIKKVDGDTIKVKFNGQDLTVRYLNIDTPETVKKNTPVQEYGPEASEYNGKILANAKKVELEFDVKQKLDKYGRALAYVYADGKLVQEELLKEGLAEIKYVYEPDTRYLDILKKAQNQAKSNKKNLWSK